MAVYPIRSCVVIRTVPWLGFALSSSNCCAYTLLSFTLLPLSNSPSFPLLKSRVDPLYSAEPILFPCRHIFLPVCLSAVVLDMHCSKITLEQVRPSHAPPATSNASPSCSRAVATSRRVEIHDAIDAKAHLPSPDGDGSCSETSVL